MRLSKRGEYGVRAMIYLARSDTPLTSIREIAENENIPGKYLEQIMLELKNGGLLGSKMGIGGGYYLARSAEKIKIGEIVRELDGPLAPIRCVSEMAYEKCDCPDETTCGLRMTMQSVRNSIASVLDNTTLADVAQKVDKAANGG
jgi:Rrf2 family protein